MTRTTVEHGTARKSGFERWPHTVLAALILIAVGIVAIGSYQHDSITFDEPSKLTAGMSYWRTGDFRLGPDHPPLAKLWCALPLLLVPNEWPGAEVAGWRSGNVWQVANAWLFELNDGPRLVTAARAMNVVLLLGTCATVFAVTRRLFGRTAALVALLVAGMSPTLLAHATLVSNDLALALLTLLTLTAGAAVVRRITLLRVVALGLALAALSVTKFSWPLILPPLALLAVLAVVRAVPIGLGLPAFGAVPRRITAPAATQSGAAAGNERALTGRPQKTAALSIVAVVVAAIVWGAIWTAYGWRYSPFAADSRENATMMATNAGDQPLPETMDGAWETILQDWQGRPLHGPASAIVQWAREHRLLPEAYLYGLAYTRKTTLHRLSYLNGRVYPRGHWAFFPEAFLLKTPVPVLVLITLGVIAVVRDWRGSQLLLVGMLAFVLLYFGTAVYSSFNIGQRHLLPIYPILAVLAGASIRCFTAGFARWIPAAAVAWLFVVNITTYPHYLSYFNILAGGTRNGHRFLADSNLDWGQDLRRLADYAALHPGETIKLAYFGTTPPAAYGLRCELLPSYKPFSGTVAQLTPGTYVISITQLVGVYDPLIAGQFWENPRNRLTYRKMHELAENGPPPNLTAGQQADVERALRQYELLRPRRLIAQLRHRPPDARIGTSMLVFRLSQSEIDELLAP